MKVYTFKCEDCGSKKYEKLDESTYVCSYCGRVEEVFFKKEQLFLYFKNFLKGDFFIKLIKNLI